MRAQLPLPSIGCRVPWRVGARARTRLLRLSVHLSFRAPSDPGGSGGSSIDDGLSVDLRRMNEFCYREGMEWKQQRANE